MIDTVLDGKNEPDERKRVGAEVTWKHEVNGEVTKKIHRFPNGLQNDMLSLFRVHYPEMFMLKPPPKKKNTFFQLISS